MITRRLRVRPMFPEDAKAVVAIARANGLPPTWEWIPGAHGAVAVMDDTVVAFCAMREIPAGMVIDELWAIPGSDGLRGLGKLAAWLERTVQFLSDQRKDKLSLGGIVTLQNKTHRDALKGRDYKLVAEVYAKEFFPKERAVHATA